MRDSLYRELYKFTHKKITWFAPMIMVGFMVFMVSYPGARLLTMLTYDSSDAITLVLVIVGSTMFSMEFQNNAILTLLYKSPKKIDVYVAKLITIFVYDIILHCLALLLTIVLEFTIKPVSWMSVYQYHQPLLVNMILATGIDIITSMLIISLIFLASTLINSNATVITVTMVIVFFGRGISADLMNYNSPLKPLARWNPLNMTMLTSQYGNYSMYHETTILTNFQILFGAMAYVIVFLGLGYLVFRKKRF